MLVTRCMRIACCGLMAAGAIGFLGAASAADVELGRYLSSECTTCHSPHAHSAIPNIHGMMETTFTEVVKAYRERRLANPVMQNVAARLNDEDIAALAAYFASAKKTR